MDALTALTTRRTPIRLEEPAPDEAGLGRLLEAAVAAPDHGKVRPWRFLIVRGKAREALGEVLARALLAREPDAPEPLLAKERAKPLRAPLILVVAAELDPEHPKIPVSEQLLAAGSAAQNVQLAAHALGFGCAWKSGKPAYDPLVKRALGLAESDEIVGFLYLGTPVGQPGARALDWRDFTREWQPE